MTAAADSSRSYEHRSFRPGDVLAGITVAAVLVPQALAYATLAGMPPERGLYAAAIPLLVAAPLASSPYLQTGPVALSSLLTFGALSAHAAPGSDEYIQLGLLLALIVGVLRVIIGLTRGGVIVYLMSQPLLLGFIPAAALLILCSQLPAAFASDPPDGGIIEQAGWVLGHPGSWEATAVVMSVLVVVVVLGGRRIHALFPGALVAVLGALLFSVLSGYDGPTVGSIPAGFPPISVDLPYDELPSLIVAGAVIAVLGFAEAGSIARKYAAEDRARWDSNREFVSSGAGNVAAAFSGGFPIGASFARSSLNRMAGVWSRWSGAVTGLCAIAVLFVTGVFEDLPIALLGAVVIAGVLPLITPGRILELWRPSHPQFVIAAVTFVATLALSPHIEQGVLVGVGLSIAIHLWRELRIDLELWEEPARSLHARPSGVLWFGAAQDLEDRLQDELAHREGLEALTVHMDAIGRLDMTGALCLRAVRDEAERSGVAWSICGVCDRDERLVERVIQIETSPCS